MKSTCPRCNNWTVGGANYCHTCAWPLNSALAGNPGGMTFEAAIGAGVDGSQRPGRALTLDWKNRATLALVGGLGATVGVAVANWEPALIPFAALTTGTADIALNSLERLFWRERKAEPEPERTVIAFEHVALDHDGRISQLGFYDFPAGVELSQIQHIGRKVLEPPAGEGRRFSRRALTKVGTLSQDQFEAIRDALLAANYLFWRNEMAPTTGLILTERGRRLFAKALKM